MISLATLSLSFCEFLVSMGSQPLSCSPIAAGQYTYVEKIEMLRPQIASWRREGDVIAEGMKILKDLHLILYSEEGKQYLTQKATNALKKVG